MSTGKERRGFSRIPVECKIHFAVGPEEDPKKRSYLASHVKDLSTQGVSFESKKAFEPGTFFHLKMEFPRKETTVKVRGSVQRCEALGAGHYVIGVKFFGSATSLAGLFSSCF